MKYKIIYLKYLCLYTMLFIFCRGNLLGKWCRPSSSGHRNHCNNIESQSFLLRLQNVMGIHSEIGIYKFCLINISPIV